jgi:hypothetical protein
MDLGSPVNLAYPSLRSLLLSILRKEFIARKRGSREPGNSARLFNLEVHRGRVHAFRTSAAGWTPDPLDDALARAFGPGSPPLPLFSVDVDSLGLSLLPQDALDRKARGVTWQCLFGRGSVAIAEAARSV